MVDRPSSLAIAILIFAAGCSCSRLREDLDYDFDVEQTWVTDDFGGTIVQFASVPYRPQNTALLRSEVATTRRVDSRSVLELGSGTGYFAIQCANEGAKQVIVLATDRAAHACVRYNVAVAHQDSVVESRLVAPGADSVLAAIKPKEQFDYVVVNTEMTLGEPLIRLVIEQLPNWLRGGGKGWVICENQQVIDLVTSRCQSLGFGVDVMQYSDTTVAVDPASFPQTLQIDPFTPAARAAAKSEANVKSQTSAESGDAKPTDDGN
jgi:16S rRNA G966 N2-methylase RsmD